MRKKIYVSWRTAFLFILVWFIGASILLDFWPIVRSGGEWKTVTNMEYGFSVDYPTKWKARTYGEHGFKGEDEIKLLIYRSLLGVFEIAVEYQELPNPTLQDAVAWGKSQINDTIRNFTVRGEQPVYESLELKEDVINGHTVMRHTYRFGNVMHENVYIARANDIIIISLQADQADFDSYLEDFNAIVSSFRPLD